MCSIRVLLMDLIILSYQPGIIYLLEIIYRKLLNIFFYKNKRLFNCMRKFFFYQKNNLKSFTLIEISNISLLFLSSYI